MKKRLFLMLSLFIIVSTLLVACGGAAAPASTAAPQVIEVTKMVEGTPVVTVVTATPAPMMEYGPVTIWTKFNDTNPQVTSDQWLADTIIDLKRKENIDLINVFAPYDQINNKLQLAVQSGGDVPDLSWMDTPLDPFYNNGTLMDITDWVKSTSWYKDVPQIYWDPCTGPDGKIYCVPAVSGGQMIYYWTSAYPNGFPKDTDGLLAAAPGLKEKGLYALTTKISEGAGSGMLFFHLVHSFGGKYTDDQGNSAFATPETVKAIEVVRELFYNKYLPDADLAPGFEDEKSFMDGTAGAFTAGAYSYIYLNPLKSPDGQVFDNGAGSVEAAMKAGALKITDVLSAPGGIPMVNANGASGWTIPISSKNVEGAKAVIDFMMQPSENADFAYGFGGLPTNQLGMKDPRFVNKPYWQAVNEAMTRSGVMAPVNKNPKMYQLFNDTVINLIQNPKLDIMTELQRAQDALNAGQ